MTKNSDIEWTNYTFNPWIGCARISPGCDHCSAEAESARRGWATWGKGEPRKRTSAATWKNPLDWNRAAKTAGERRRVFCTGLGDVFDAEVDPLWRSDLWNLVRETPFLDWLFITRRPAAIRSMLPPDWGKGWLNVGLIVSVEDQERTARIAELVEIPARFRGVLLEPLLGPVQLKQEWMPNLNWILVAGEPGENARPMHPDWARSIRQQCAASGVNFFFKGWGAWSLNGKFAKMDLSNVAYFEPGTERPLFLRDMETGSRQALLDNRGKRIFMFRGNEAKTGKVLDGRHYLAHPFGREIAPLLDHNQRERLETCQQTIHKGLQTFVDVGMALMEIRNSRLYLETHPTFEAYVQSVMALSRPRAYELMDSAQVMRDLSAIGGLTQLPRNEAQVRELRRWKTPEERAEKWKTVLAVADKRPLTATFIRKTLNPHLRVVESDPPEGKLQGYLKKLRTQVTGNAVEQNAMELISKLEKLIENGEEAPIPEPQPVQQAAPAQGRIIRFQMSGPGSVKIVR